MSGRLFLRHDQTKTVDQINEATKLLHEHGIGVGFFLQYGYPGEDRPDIEKTLRMVRECMPEEIGVSSEPRGR